MPYGKAYATLPGGTAISNQISNAAKTKCFLIQWREAKVHHSIFLDT
jgi:hypothetical protein